MADETLLTCWPPAPWARTAWISISVSGIVMCDEICSMSRHTVSKRHCFTGASTWLSTHLHRGSRERVKLDEELAQFRQTVDDAEPNFVANLHLHHFSRETGAHTLGILQLELHLASATLDKVKKQHRGKPVEFLVGGVLAHVEDLGHASRPFLVRL